MEISKQSIDHHHHHPHNNESIRSANEVVAAEDLILKILYCLPPVSVLRFKSVCKSWYSLISNPFFLRNYARQFHLRRDRLDPLIVAAGLLSNPTDQHHTLPTENPFLQPPPDQHHTLPTENPFLQPPPDQQDEQNNKLWLKTLFDHSLPSFRQKFPSCVLVDSCNGLLLYYHETETDDGLDLQKHYIVFNPITNEYREVPVMDLLLQTFTTEEVKNNIFVCKYPHVVFDPSISLSYKVIVCLSRGNPCYHYEFYFYSPDTNSWRLLTSLAGVDNRGISRRTAMLDGVFYLLKHDVSICFDYVKENVWFLPLPPVPSDKFRYVYYFGVCGGRLRLIEDYFCLAGDWGSRFPCKFDIMEMEQGSMTWTLKSRVHIEGGYDIIQGKSVPFRGLRVMHLYETDIGEEAVLLKVDYKRIISFNITTNTFGKELTIPYLGHKCLNAFSFTPTLFPLLT